ncbi:uncharacterized protein [Haliotis asinina]|uniref:uncharacterized protein n=1 Tax=Haliotis asinina TaxID=109174 RepID=UPI0035328048
MDYVLFVVVFVSAVIVGIVCTCLCLAGLRLCGPTKSNVRPSAYDERRETEATTSLFEETDIADDETAYNQYLTASVHHAIQDTLTTFTKEGTLDRQTEDLYHHLLESTSRHVLQNTQINDTHLSLRGTETDTATSEVNDHCEGHYQACGDIDNPVPHATVSRRGLEVSVASSGTGDATPLASGGGWSGVAPRDSDEVPLESFREGTRQSQESRDGNVYESLGNRETICLRTRTSVPGSGSVSAEIEMHGSADAGDTCQELDASIQRAVRDYFSRPIRDILQGNTGSDRPHINTEPLSDIDHAVHYYLTNIINTISLQWRNETSRIWFRQGLCNYAQQCGYTPGSLSSV